MEFMGKNIRRVILEIVGTVGEEHYKYDYLKNIISGEENYIHISLTNNKSNVWENQKSF